MIWDCGSGRDVVNRSVDEFEENEGVERINIHVLKDESVVVVKREIGASAVLCSDSSNDDDDDDDGKPVGLTRVNDYTVSPNGSFRCNITSWQKGDFLGSGSFGTVYEGFTDDGVFFAVKEVSLLDNGSQGQQSLYQLEQEISLLSQFQHENIVRYLGTDKDDAKLYIFLELVTKGSLAKLYQKYRLRDSQVSAYTRQILSGLNYLHCRNVVHRDIKCANILVDVSGFVKLADFGLAKVSFLGIKDDHPFSFSF
ncbi:mitogen-activated protein kinase kinase kinase 1-like [Primulina tabacum]|uniref:mitogen-activated protein kinase kinase kinase 1-like n=1 Tax=Primulina tabacum TaxID=48773 RepID=UPI003F59C30A